MEIPFTNREIAYGIIALAFIVWVSRYAPVRNSFKGLVSAAASPKLVTPVLSTWFWITLGVTLLAHLELWDLSLLKETLIWAVFSGITTLFLGVSSDDPNRKFARSLSSQFKVGVVIVFYVNLVTFPLLVEIPLILTLTFLSLIQAVSEQKNVSKYIGRALGFAGIILFIVVTWKVIQQPKLIFSFEAVKSFALPFALVIWTIPFGYLFSVLAAYEELFNRLNLKRSQERDLRFYNSLHLFASGRLNASRIKRMDKLLSRKPTWVKNHDEIDDLFKKLGITLQDPDNRDARDFIWPEPELFPGEVRYTSVDDYLEIVNPLFERLLSLWESTSEMFERTSKEGILPKIVADFLVSRWPKIDALYHEINQLDRAPSGAEKFDQELHVFSADLHQIYWFYSPENTSILELPRRDYLVFSNYRSAVQQSERLSLATRKFSKAHQHIENR